MSKERPYAPRENPDEADADDFTLPLGDDDFNERPLDFNPLPRTSLWSDDDEYLEDADDDEEFG